MKTNLENIKKELASRNINAEQIEVVKNGIPCVGFRIFTGTNIAPVVYYSQTDTLENFMFRISDALSHTPDFDISSLTDKEFVLENLYISVQRRGCYDDTLKLNFLNLDAILRVHVGLNTNDKSGSIKVTEQLLKLSGISSEEAWEQAISNTASHFEVNSMADILGIPEELFPTPFYVVTTEHGIDGAAALLYTEIFQNFCWSHQATSCIILPSSTQEVLILPDDGTMCYDDFAAMVRDVNAAEVDPLIQLDPVAYLYDLASNQIQIVATA